MDAAEEIETRRPRHRWRQGRDDRTCGLDRHRQGRGRPLRALDAGADAGQRRLRARRPGDACRCSSSGGSGRRDAHAGRTPRRCSATRGTRICVGIAVRISTRIGSKDGYRGGIVADDKILVDPGIGFGKSAAGNLVDPQPAPGATDRRAADPDRRVTKDLHRHRCWACPWTTASRKAWPWLHYASVASGAHVIRAHDVTETVRTVRMIDALRVIRRPYCRSRPARRRRQRVCGTPRRDTSD